MVLRNSAPLLHMHTSWVWGAVSTTHLVQYTLAATMGRAATWSKPSVVRDITSTRQCGYESRGGALSQYLSDAKNQGGCGYTGEDTLQYVHVGTNLCQFSSSSILLQKFINLTWKPWLGRYLMGVVLHCTSCGKANSWLSHDFIRLRRYTWQIQTPVHEERAYIHMHKSLLY